MKSLTAALLLLVTILGGSKREFGLVYRSDEDRGSIADQVRQGFVELLNRDAALKNEFEQLQSAARQRAGGRYALGKARTLVIPRSESVDFSDASGTRAFAETVVLYFPFVEGEHRGMTVTEGTFVCFAVSGSVHYTVMAAKHTVREATITARFTGFQKDISAEQADRGEPPQ